MTSWWMAMSIAMAGDLPVEARGGVVASIEAISDATSTPTGGEVRVLWKDRATLAASCVDGVGDAIGAPEVLMVARTTDVVTYAVPGLAACIEAGGQRLVLHSPADKLKKLASAPALAADNARIETAGTKVDAASQVGKTGAPSGSKDPLTLVGACDLAQVRERVATLGAAHQACAGAATGTVEVNFIIAADGGVSSSKLARSTLTDDAINECILDSFRPLAFPPPSTGTCVVMHTIVLGP